MHVESNGVLDSFIVFTGNRVVPEYGESVTVNSESRKEFRHWWLPRDAL